MVRGRLLWVVTGVLLLALAVGLSGVGQADTAGALSAPSSLPTLPTIPTTLPTIPTIPTTLPTLPTTLPTLPATLVAITVSPALADVAVGAGEQFTATGIYSDLSTRDLTDSVTWSSSASATATVSNTPGSQGLATGSPTGATRSPPPTELPGVGHRRAHGDARHGAGRHRRRRSRQLALTPAEGRQEARGLAQGSGFTPGSPVTVTYLSGLKARKRASTVLCHTMAASNGSLQLPRRHPPWRQVGKTRHPHDRGRRRR